MHPAAWILIGWLVLLAVIDARTGRLPNRLVLPAVAAALVLGVLIPAAGISGLVAAAPYLVGFRLRQVGGGDVKLAFVIGTAVADPIAALLVVLAAQLLWLTGVLIAAVVTRNRLPSSPHGPALALAATVALCVG